MKLIVLNKKLVLGFLTIVLLSGCEQPYNILVSGNPAGNAPGVNPTPTNIPTSAPTGTPLPAPSLPPVIVPSGLLNGHFDLDTATAGMPYDGTTGAGNGTVTAHVHEYDKVNQTTTADFFNLSNEGEDQEAGNALDQIQDTLAPSQRFYLISVNAALNPGAVLEINDNAPTYATTYQAEQEKILAAGGKPQAYTIGVPTVGGDIQLKKLIVAFDPTVDANSLLIPTGPMSCVIPNIAGPKGEYRDGALVLQAVNPVNFIQDKETGAALPPIGGMLWEGMIYNHYMAKGLFGSEYDPEYCYGQVVNGSVFY